MTRSGGRLPHVFLADGRALFDQLAPAFTLIAIGDVDLGGLDQVVGDLPLGVVRLEREPVLERWSSRLILVRPDQHISWHSTEAPADWANILNTAVGRRIA